MKRTLILSAALLAAALVAVGLPAAALAAPPANDDFANATVIDPSSLPFDDSVPLDEATTEGVEPQNCYYTGQSIWYAITPSSKGALRVDPAGSNFSDSVLNVYRQDGSGLGGLSFRGCAAWGSPVAFSAEAGETYYVQAGKIYGGSGNLHIDVQSIPPPSNDDFSNAQNVSSVPFSGSVDGAGATTEANEPNASCGSNPQQGTAWYRLTASASGSLSASGGYYNTMAVYTGGGIGSLTEIGCRNYGSLVSFHADAGTTYYFQVSGFAGNTSLQFQLVETPSPNVGFYFYPNDPSSFENVQFIDQSNDPGQLGFSSEKWEFGDGSSSTNPGCCPTHRFGADGDYKVKLTVTTTDGRTGSSEQVVHVRTHDVTIAKLTVPQSATVGQTRSIIVGISNKRYPETVQVQLYKSGPNGFELVGTLQQSVPVRGGGRTTDFKFSYTFTSADAALGKVTFRAVASIVGARDAIPADNDVVALPTKVS